MIALPLVERKSIYELTVTVLRISFFEIIAEKKKIKQNQQLFIYGTLVNKMLFKKSVIGDGYAV